MSIHDPQKLAECLKGKNVLLVAGQLCVDVDFGEKKLLDYVVEIGNKINAPIAATGNTPKPLKEKGAKLIQKAWAAEIMNFMRWPWEYPVIDKKPDILVLMGYGPSMAQGLVSSVKDGKTMVLGNTLVKEADYSLEGFSSLSNWQESLEKFVQAL